MPEALVGRQPIFDRALRVHAYELLFRRAPDSGDGSIDGNQATAEVIANTFMELGLDRLVGQHRAFINVTAEFLTDPTPLPLPRDRVVLEILEDIDPDERLVQGVSALVRDGYSVALDDFVYRPEWEPVMAVADYVKVDVRAQALEALPAEVARLRRHNLALLAEKVETEEEYERLRAIGFDYFQGYFLERPHVVSGKRVPAGRYTALRVISQINQGGSPAEVAQVLAQDAGLTYKLLRYINSAAFALPRPIGSVRQGIVYLGHRAVSRWASLVAMAQVPGRPNTIMLTALARARMCELLALAAGRPEPEVYFTVGLFSTLDALLQAPMTEVLDDLPLAPAVAGALLRREGPFGEALDCATAQERWQWQAVRFAGLSPEQINAIYLQALAWSVETGRHLFSEG